MAVIGVFVGAGVTSLLAGLITAENTTFIEPSLHVNDGEILGLFVTNKDSFGYSFDIDSLDVDVQLPSNSPTAVAIKPTGPGNIEFFCNVPGHLDAGMVGTIDVG
ncbi:MAG TPA: cupredoxin domain-containing protein [Acidimicrobiia bacterium]|nr:cupredoxin domain-containing protein [Acidimicrobiia bacterium]